MKLYFSGIGGVGLAPLALIAVDCGFEVFGSDKNPSLSSAELEKRGIEITFEQSFEEIQTAYKNQKFDWLVVTAALPQNHPHLQFAKENNIKISKRDELLNYILEQKKLKLIAVAGTHGKTTTTAMVTWLFKQNNIPVSYLIGSNISFGPAGKYEEGSQYFVLECDEFDKNFLHFKAEISLITSLDYDHPDSYPTKQDYLDSFQQFLNQTKKNICIWNEDFKKLDLKDITAKVHNFESEEKPNSEYLKLIKLAGLHNRKNGFLAISATSLALSETLSDNTVVNKVDSAKLNNSLSTFPGTERRFEKLRNGLYSDYAHHPVEIAATIQLAKEVQEMGNFNKLVIIYQPHQNLRQHDKTIQQGYKSCFNFTDKLYWLPTYLSRENKDLEILTPIMLAENLEGFSMENLTQENSFTASNYSGELFGEFVEFNDYLKNLIQTELDNNNLVVCFGAGNIDEFVRKNFSKN
jgi:UDP-N-acetylmuramate--alanine ligase